VSRITDDFIRIGCIIAIIVLSCAVLLYLLNTIILQHADRHMQSNQFAPIVERMIAETAVKVPVGLERSGAFHVDRLPCGTTLYLLPCRRGNVFAMRAYVIDDDFPQIAGLSRDAKMAIRDAVGDPLYTRLGRIVWRTQDLEITLYVGHRVIEIGANDLHGDWR